MHETMGRTEQKVLERRVKFAGNFEDKTFYLQYLRYFDIIAQVHSVVETQYGTWILRVWRATRLGPEKYEEARQNALFRVQQEYFHRYIVPPDPRIAKAVAHYGYKHLMEIEIYDNHRDRLEALRSSDFLAIINVHYCRGKIGDSLKLHGGNIYNRGLWRIPDDCHIASYLDTRRRIEIALQSVHDYADFVEFTSDAQPIAMPTAPSHHSSSKSSSDHHRFFTPKRKPQKRRYKSFAAAAEEGKEVIAKPCQKIVIGDIIAVDWFGKRDAKKFHFLTHGHSDHCGNLNRKWAQKVYCSPITSQILPRLMGYESIRDVPPGIIHPLELGTPHQFDGFTVTLIDANHCPGAVMFLFEGDEIPGGRVLCTGDFRADKTLMEKFQAGKPLHFLTQKKISTVYLDNTYFELNLSFPERQNGSAELFKRVREHPGKNIYIPLHRLGREDMIEELSRSMMEPVMAYEEKKSMACAMSYFFEFGIKNPARTIRVVKRNKWQLAEGEEHLDFVIFDVSMLHHLTVSDGMIEKYKSKVVRIPYSDHSSREEIIAFLKLLNFTSVVPTSKPTRLADLQVMVACTKDSIASLKASEEKLVIEQEHEDPIVEEEEEIPLPPTAEPVKNGKHTEEELQRIYEMGMDLDSIPLPPPLEEPAVVGMGSTLEATLEEMFPAPATGILDIEGTPGPSEPQQFGNLDLDMDMGMMGMDIPTVPATPSPYQSHHYGRSSTSSSSRHRHHHYPQRMDYNGHSSHHNQYQNGGGYYQYQSRRNSSYRSHYPSENLEIDDVSMVVQQAEENHRNFQLRLASPEEQTLETLQLSPTATRHHHQNGWYQTATQSRDGVFSPLYNQDHAAATSAASVEPVTTTNGNGYSHVIEEPIKKASLPPEDVPMTNGHHLNGNGNENGHAVSSTASSMSFSSSTSPTIAENSPIGMINVHVQQEQEILSPVQEEELMEDLLEPEKENDEDVMEDQGDIDEEVLDRLLPICDEELDDDFLEEPEESGKLEDPQKPEEKEQEEEKEPEVHPEEEQIDVDVNVEAEAKEAEDPEDPKEDDVRVDVKDPEEEDSEDIVEEEEHPEDPEDPEDVVQDVVEDVEEPEDSKDPEDLEDVVELLEDPEEDPEDPEEEEVVISPKKRRIEIETSEEPEELAPDDHDDNKKDPEGTEAPEDVEDPIEADDFSMMEDRFDKQLEAPDASILEKTTASEDLNDALIELDETIVEEEEDPEVEDESQDDVEENTEDVEDIEVEEEESEEEEEIDPELDKWSEGAPRSMKDAIARLSATRKRQRAQ